MPGMPLQLSRPLKILRMPGGFKIVDAGKRTLVYIYARERQDQANAAGALLYPEAEELARTIARSLTAPGPTEPCGPNAGLARDGPAGL